jgi:hypothetical protein
MAAAQRETARLENLRFQVPDGGDRRGERTTTSGVAV